MELNGTDKMETIKTNIISSSSSSSRKLTPRLRLSKTNIVVWAIHYLYLLQHVLQLNQELLSILGLVRDSVQSLGELALQGESREAGSMITLFCVWHYNIELRAEDAWRVVNEVLSYLQPCTNTCKHNDLGTHIGPLTHTETCICTYVHCHTHTHIDIHTHTHTVRHMHTFMIIITYTQSHTHVQICSNSNWFHYPSWWHVQYLFLLEQTILSRNSQQKENVFHMTPYFRQDQAHNQVGALAPGNGIQYQGLLHCKSRCDISVLQPFANSPCVAGLLTNMQWKLLASSFLHVGNHSHTHTHTDRHRMVLKTNPHHCSWPVSVKVTHQRWFDSVMTRQTAQINAIEHNQNKKREKKNTFVNG